MENRVRDLRSHNTRWEGSEATLVYENDLMFDRYVAMQALLAPIDNLRGSSQSYCPSVAPASVQSWRFSGNDTHVLKPVLYRILLGIRASIVHDA